MARQVHIFRSPERFLAGTIGVPGEREFFFQVVDGRQVVSVSCEKQQVAVLAEKLGTLIAEISRRFGEAADDTAASVDTAGDAGLDTPVDAEFRVGTMALAWDGEHSQVIVELLALSEEEVGEDVALEDTDDGPDALRVFLTLDEALQFARHAERVVAAGRPPCPLCGNPLDAQGHICPRLNGYHRSPLG